MRFLVVIIFVIMSQVSAYANVAVLGKTYEIAEKDYIEALRDKAKQVEWDKLFAPETMKKKVSDFQPINTVRLPKAAETETYFTDPTYTLEYDIKAPDGRIMYPAGYRFNPLDYAQMPMILVVIDGSDKKQVEWFQKSAYANDQRTMLLLSDGKWGAVKKKLSRDVFYLSMRLAERIQVKNVPSVVMQSGNMMEIRTYAIDKN